MAKLFENVKSLREAQDAINALRKQIDFFKSIAPNVSPTTGEKRYVIGGVNYTQTGFDKEVNSRETRIKELYEKWIKPVGEPQAAQSRAANQKQVDDLFQKLSPRKVELEQQIKSLEQADRKATSANEQDNIRTWLTYYKSALADLNIAINNLRAGVLPNVVPPEVKFATVSDSKKTAAPIPFATSNLGPTVAGGRGQATNIVGQPMGGGPTAGVTTPATTTPVATTQSPVIPPPETVAPAAQAGVLATGLTAGQRGEAGIFQGLTETTTTENKTNETVTGETVSTSSETPASTTNVPTGTPGSVPSGTPTAPSFTDPATGATYQPGQQVGGENRTLPNGGAVVDGVYIPPGIDYTWLGQQVPPDWESAAKELYGGYYEMVKQYPELGTLLKNAIQQGWSDDKFQYELQQTNWWRTTTQNAREFETLRIQDPASAQTQLDNRTALLRDTAQRLGITLGAESLAKLAEDSIKLGLDMTSQLEDIIGSEAIRTSGGVSQLRYGFVGQSLRESASKYGVALSDVTFNEWVNKIAVGAESTETFETYAAQIARTLYPTLSSGFDRGLSFAQMTDPYAQAASRILEIPATQVDFTDPKWAQAFTMKNDKGEQVPMSYGEWADYLRSTPTFGWEYTDDAKNRAFTVANRLAELFGAA